MIETGIKFDSIHSFHDLNLILSSVSIPPALPKTSYVDVPGMDGTLDQTEVHGEVKYSDRDGCKFVFTMNPAGDLSEAAYEEKKTEVSNRLNGRIFEKITLDKDPDYYYSGRCTVSEYLSDKRVRQIVVTAKVNPYKLKQEPTVYTCELTSDGVRLLTSDGYVLTDANGSYISGENAITLKNGRKSVVPIFECTDDNTIIVFGNSTYTLGAGTHKILDICFKEGDNVLKVSGSGTLKITYQEGNL